MFPLTEKDIAELCDVRSGLEAAATRALARAISAEQLTELSRLAAAADRALAAASSRFEWDQAEEAFHRRMVEMSGNSRIREMLVDEGLLARLLTMSIPDWRQRRRLAAPSHEELVEALAGGDADLCDRLSRAHTAIRQRLLLNARPTA